jgi:hypothetical protein
VVLAQDVEQLFGGRRFREGGEAAQIREQTRDVRAVPGQELLADPAGDELCHLRRDEPGELRALPLDRLDQARIRNRDRRLVGEGLHERDVLVRERLRFTAGENDAADEVVLDHHRNRDQRSVVLGGTAIGVFRIVVNVRDVDRLTFHRRPPSARRSVKSMGMLYVPLSTLGVGVVRDRAQEPVLEKVQGAVVGSAEPLTGFYDLVQDGLDPRAADDGAEDTADRALLFAHVVELASELGVVERYTGHLGSLGPGGVPVSLRRLPTPSAGTRTDAPTSESVKRGLAVGAGPAMKPVERHHYVPDDCCHLFLFTQTITPAQAIRP